MNDNGVPERSFAFNFYMITAEQVPFILRVRHGIRKCRPEPSPISLLRSTMREVFMMTRPSRIMKVPSSTFLMRNSIREYSLVHRGISDWLDPEGEPGLL